MSARRNRMVAIDLTCPTCPAPTGSAPRLRSPRVEVDWYTLLKKPRLFAFLKWRKIIYNGGDWS